MLIYTYDFNIAAFIFILLLNLIFFLKQVYHSKRNSIFHVMLLISLFTALTEAGYHYFNECSTSIALPFLYLTHLIYYVLFVSVYLAFYIFVLESMETVKLTLFNRLVIVISVAATVILAFLTLFTNCIFYYDSTRLYHQGSFAILWFVLIAFLTICTNIQIHVKRESYNHELMSTAFYLFVLTCILFLLKKQHPDILYTGFVLAVFLFILFFYVDNDDLYFDKTVGCYNNRAFIDKATSFLTNKKTFTIVSFTVNEYAYVGQVLGQQATDMLNKSIARFLYKSFGKSNIYALYQVGYALFTDSDPREINQVIKAIQTYFHEPLSLNGRLELLNPVFCIAMDPYFAKNGQQIIDEISNTFMDMKKSKANTIAYATGNYLSKVQREQQVIYAMKKAMERDSFEVYYQPIYDLDTRSVRSLEALLRLNDEELGFIPPDEFIQIAEHNGMIIDISSIAFRKVCAFIHDNDIKSLGIDYIEFNLSIVECDNPMLASDLLHVMYDYDVSPSQLNFEITETSEAHNVGELIRNMERLIEAGSTFSMDDYGTGYSTTHYLIKLPLHIVKIDKSILWPAMKDEKSYNVLRQLIATIKSIDKKIVVEGVETQEMVDTLDKLKCDYLQGYFYSKPIPADEIVKYLKYTNQKLQSD